MAGAGPASAPPVQFETLHLGTADAAAVKAAVAAAAAARAGHGWRFRMATGRGGAGGAGWVSLYPELLYDPQAFARDLSAEASAPVVQVAGRDGLLWAVHVARAGRTVALFRSDAATASAVSAVAEALGPLCAKGPAAVSDVLTAPVGAWSDRYRRLAALLGIPAPRMGFVEAADLELLEFRLSQAEPPAAPKPAAAPLPPVERVP